METSYRIPWDAEEVAVLVHGYMQLKNSVLFYNEAIKYVSHTLRERALRRGMNVGETFRNENGISMQMAKIEDIFSGGKFRLSPPPQVFFDVVQLYRKDRKAFNELFERATGASSDRAALEKGFFQWLANKVPPTHPAKSSGRVPQVEQFPFRVQGARYLLVRQKHYPCDGQGKIDCELQ